MKKISVLLLLAAGFWFRVAGQVAAWDFYGQYSPDSLAATVFDPGLAASGDATLITRGPGAPASGGANSFRTTGFQNNGLAVTSADYFQVTLQPAPGFKLSLSALDARFNGTTTFFTSPGVSSRFAYSLDGIHFTWTGPPVQSTSLTLPTIDLTTVTALQNLYPGTTVTLRYFASGQTATGGWGFHSPSPGAWGLAVGGTVVPVNVVPPTVQASSLSFSNIQFTRIGVSFTPGNGERRIVKIHTTDSFTDPADGTDPPADSLYSGSGEQVVYNGPDHSFTVTGLVPGSTYWFRVYEYNGSGPLTQYLAATATGNPASCGTVSQLTPPVVLSPSVTGITPGSAVLGGRILSDGGSAVTERGTVWSLVSPVLSTDHPLAEGLADTGLFSHLRQELPPGSLVRFAAYGVNAIGTTLSPECAFFTLSAEPAQHAASFAANAGGTQAISLSWIPPVPAPDGWLVLMKTGSTAPSGAPSDGNLCPAGSPVGDGISAVQLFDGTTGSVTVQNLLPGTEYSFTLFPFRWDGLNPATANYFTGTPVPAATASTTAQTEATYHWTGAQNTDWTQPQNWSPARLIPAPNDLLVFDIGGTWTLVNIPSETVGKLSVQGGTGLSLQSAATLTLAGSDGDDLVVGPGCHLNLTGAGAFSLSLAAGASGQILGSMTFTGAGHRLTAASAGAVTFGSGSLFKAGSGFTGNPFGTLSLNSVIFAAGSVYAAQAGGNPFGAAAPSSVVVFQPGSLYRLDAYIVPSFGGRTYGHFEMNYPGSVTATGSAAVSMGNLTVTRGTFYFNVTGNPGHSVKGHITVSNLGTLIFSPSSAGTVALNGDQPQSVSGFGSLSAGPNSAWVVANAAGVTLQMNATLNHLRIASAGKLTIAPNAFVTINGDCVNEGPAGGFLLESGSSLIHQTPGTAGVVKRHIQPADWGDWQDGWHFLSSPVENQSIDSTGGFATTGAGNGFDFYAWTEPLRQWVNFTSPVSPTFVSVNGSANFLPGRGYLCAYQQGGDRRFTGILNRSDLPLQGLTVTGSAAENRGWHLLGNPFPCALTWYTGWDAVNIGGVAQVWNEEGRSYTPVSPGEPIPAGNGFMVQVLENPSGEGSLVIPSGARIHAGVPWLKEPEVAGIRLLARDLDVPCYQELRLRFDPSSTYGFDPSSDGRFLAGYAPRFHAVGEGGNLSVVSIPRAEGSPPIPCRFIRSRGNHYRIEADLTRSGSAGLVLYDRLTGTAHDFSTGDGYEFTSADGDEPDRFELRLSREPGPGPGVPPSHAYWSDGRLCVTHPGGTLLEVFRITGQRLLAREFPRPGTERIRLEAGPGCYLVRTTTGNRVAVRKIVVPV